MSHLSVEGATEIQTLLKSVEVLTPEDVVEVARNEHSALHPLFEWDDTVAAQAWRVHKARHVIERFKIVVKRSNGKARTLIVPGGVSVGDGYRDVRVVMKNRDTAIEQIENEWQRIDSLLARLIGICSVGGGWEELVKWLEKTRKEGNKRLDREWPGRRDED
jgi:hypothetical protein